MAMWILGAVFAVVGLPFVWLARRAFARERVIAAWPQTDGVITSATIKTSRHRYKDQNDNYYYRDGFTPIVRYTYTVDGTTHEGTSIARSLDGLAMDEGAAKKLLEKYAPRRQVRVLYDPADPKTAYLETRRSIGAVILFAFGMLWLGIGALLVVLSFR